MTSTMPPDHYGPRPCYTRKEFAVLIRKSSSTVKRLEKQGILSAKRTANGSVYYTDDDVTKYFYPEGIQS